MLKVFRGSLASHVLVAGVAAGLSALVTWQGSVLVTPSAAGCAAEGVTSTEPCQVTSADSPAATPATNT